jgi:lysophospholipase L1-like esterase
VTPTRALARAGALLAALALHASTACAEPGPASPVTPSAGWHYSGGAGRFLEDNGGLSGFFAALAQAESGTYPAGRVAIVQIGDSHTAADFFTSRLRQRLQAHFGDGGRGFMLPGRPFRYYGQRDAEYGSKGTWKLISGRKLDQGLLEPLGLAGMRVRASSPSAEAYVGTCSHCKAGRRVSRFEVFYRPLPAGGRLEYRVDEEAWKSFTTQSGETRARPGTRARGGAGGPVAGEPAMRLGYHEIPVPDGPHRLTVRPAGDGPVELYGIVSERQASGVVVDALGINGARAAHLFGWDFNYVGEQLAHRDPKLVIVAYGTNEAADGDKTDVSSVRRMLHEVVRRIQRGVPGASVLLLGPPDMARGEPAGCGEPRRRRGARKRRRPRNYLPCQYRTPALLEEVVALQRQTARDQGVAFFDSLAAVGGKNSMDGLYRQSPALAGRDRVHYTARGYEVWADRLFDELMARYQTWKRAATGGAFQPPSAGGAVRGSPQVAVRPVARPVVPVPAERPVATPPPLMPPGTADPSDDVDPSGDDD